MDPLVSIKVVTYNHYNYIGKCLDSLLAQKTKFPYEIVVGEDQSTDGTRELVFEYQKKFPDKIKIVTSDKNVGVRENGIRTKKACKGKYTAICDGDDYWNDENKLQKQVDFLESNPDFALVYSDIDLVDEKNNPTTLKNIEKMRNDYKSGAIFWDLWKSCFINTNTVVVRTSVQNSLIERGSNDPEKWYIYDYWSWLNIAKSYKIKFIDERLATYRVHEGGISRNKSFYEIRPFLVKLDVISGGLRKELLATKQNRKKIIGLLVNVLIKIPVSFKYKALAFRLLFKFPPTPGQIMNEIL